MKYKYSLGDLAKELKRDPKNVMIRIKKLSITGRKRRNGKRLFYTDEHLEQLLNYKKTIFSYDDINKNIFDSGFKELNIVYENNQFFAIVPSASNHYTSEKIDEIINNHSKQRPPIA